MVLFLKAIDTKDQYREFNCQFDQLEMAFEFLSRLVAEGETLIDAYIVDKEKRQSLSLEAFDGMSFLPVMNELEKEWQSALNRPTAVPPVGDQSLIELTQRRVQLYEKRVGIYENMITSLTELLHHTEDRCFSESRKEHLIRQYEAMIYRNQLELIQAQVCLKYVVQRLEQLTV